MSNSIVQDYLEALTVTKVAELQAENARLREALEQYADDKNWDKGGFAFSRVWAPDDLSGLADGLCGDGYTLARRALGRES